jgi:hypothetical protein
MALNIHSLMLDEVFMHSNHHTGRNAATDASPPTT